MIIELKNKINKIDNPYVSLALSLDQNQGASIVPLLKFITENTKEDINQNIFNIEVANSRYSRYSQNSEINIKMSNILDILGDFTYDNDYGWDTEYPSKIFNLLEKKGLDFTREVEYWSIDFEQFNTWNNINNEQDLIQKIKDANITSKFTDVIFNKPLAGENRNICLLGHAYKQMSQDEFVSRVIKYQTLHEAVENNNKNLIKFLIEECKIDPNLKNSDLSTPLLNCNTVETLEFLGQYKINWFSKNVLGKDCLSFFTAFTDKEKSKEMIDFAQKRMNETINDFVSEEVDQNYIKNRIKQNLLEMVTADKTKKELEDFIKKYKISSFSDIFDENGNSLAQICLEKMNWARYKLFKDHYPLGHTNKNGIGYLELLFPLYNVPHASKAEEIMFELIKNKNKEKNPNFTMNIINRAIEKEHCLNLPSFYFDEKITYDRVEPFVGKEHVGPFIKMFQKNYKRTYANYINNISNELNGLKTTAFLLLTNAVVNNENINFEKISVDSFFSETKDYLTDKMKPAFSTPCVANIIAIIRVIDENEHLKMIDINNLLSDFEQKESEYLIKSFHYAQKNNQEYDFVKTNKELISLLLDKKSELFSAIISNEMIKWVESEDKELAIKMSYSLMKSEIGTKNEMTNKKTIKI